MTIEKTQTLVPGTELVGRYKQSEHRCAVVEGDDERPFRLEDGRTFKSLSAAAKAITGCAVNGWRFWSLAGAKIIGSELAPAGKAPGAKATRVAQIRKLPNQKNVGAGQVKWFCSACMASFLVAGAEKPESCPEGHPREVVDEFDNVG